MAAGTPTILAPVTGEIGIRLDDVLQLLKAPYSGAGTQREVRWDIATDSGFTAIVWTTLLRENDDRALGDDWADACGASVPFLSATTYYVRVLVRNTSAETSSYSATVSFTTETARVTALAWTQAA